MILLILYVKKGTAVSSDALSMKAFLHVTTRLFIHLTLLFNACIHHR